VRELSLSDSRVVGAAIAVYIAVVVVMSYHFNVSLTPDRLVLLLLIAGLATGRARQFLKDWSVFLIVLLAWQLLTGMGHKIGHGIKPHVMEMITVDKWLFGGNVPTIWLQHRFYHPGRVAWYDVVATIFYTLHFVFPILFAFLLWVFRRRVFVDFMVTFLIMALAGFITFVLFPAAPPWIAGNWYHVLPHVYKIYNAGITFFGGQLAMGPLYQWMFSHQNWDYYGAVPSEHAAFPFLCFLFARQVWPRAGWLVLPYCFCVWVSIVYLGEHYVADVIAGVAYASVSYAAVRFAYALGRRKVDREVPRVSAAAASDSVPF